MIQSSREEFPGSHEWDLGVVLGLPLWNKPKVSLSLSQLSGKGKGGRQRDTLISQLFAE